MIQNKATRYFFIENIILGKENFPFSESASGYILIGNAAL